MSREILFAATLAAAAVASTAQAQEPAPPAGTDGAASRGTERAPEPGSGAAAPAEGGTEPATITVTGQGGESYAVRDSGAATRLPLTLRDTPQSVTVVTRERLDDQNLQSLRDVLDKTTGVYSYAYDTERVVFTSRGFFVDNLLYDGVPTATNWNTDSIDETLDTALYERIEIVRGANGLMTGAGSPSAAVNLVRKHADAASPRLELEAQQGSWDDTRTTADVTVPLTSSGNVRARGVAVYQHRDSFQDLYETEKKVFYGIVDADITPDTRLSFGYDQQRYMPQGNTWGSFPLFYADGSRTHFGRSVTTATDWSYWNKDKQSTFVELRQTLAADWQVRSSFTHRKYDEDLLLFYLEGFPDRQTGEGLTPYIDPTRSQGQENSFDVYATGPVKAFGREHQLVFGYVQSHQATNAWESTYEDDGAVGNFLEWDGSYPKPTILEEGRIADIRNRQNSVYGAARLQMADRVKVIAGARYDVLKQNYFYVYGGPEPFVHDHHETVPYAGLVVDVAREWSVFASYTRIFNPQNKQDPQGDILPPVRGASVETGIKGEHLGGRLNTSLTFFRTRQDNVAAPAVDPESGEPVDVPGQEGQQASVPVDGTKTRGFELEVAGSPVAGWNASLGLSHYRLRDGGGDNFRTYIPRTMVRMFTTWKVPRLSNALAVGGSVDWQSSSHLDVFGPEGTTRIDQSDVTLIGLMARWQVTPRIGVQLNGNNLLDRRYYVLDEYGNLYFGTPASVSAGLDFRF